jgi:hypothetical protein
VSSGITTFNGILTATSTTLIPDFYLPLDGNIRNCGKTSYTTSPTSNNELYSTTQKQLFTKSFNCNAANYIKIDNSVTNNTSTYTIACWIYINTLGNKNWIYAKQTDGTNAGAVFSCSYYSSVGTPQTGINGRLYYRSHNGTIIYSSSSVVSAVTWTHVAIIVINTNTATFFVNGSSVARSIVAGSTGYTIPDITTGINATVGAWIQNGITETFDGYIQDFRFYNRALTAN